MFSEESQLQALDQESKEIEAEQNCLNAPLQEYQELEMQLVNFKDFFFQFVDTRNCMKRSH